MCTFGLSSGGTESLGSHFDAIASKVVASYSLVSRYEKAHMHEQWKIVMILSIFAGFHCQVSL